MQQRQWARNHKSPAYSDVGMLSGWYGATMQPVDVPAGTATASTPFKVICQGGVCRLDRRHTEPVGTQVQPTALINNLRLSCYNRTNSNTYNGDYTMHEEIKRTLECVEKLFKEDEEGETLLGRVEDLILRAASDGVAARVIAMNLPCAGGVIILSKEYLQLKSLVAAQDVLHTLVSQVDVLRNQLNIARSMLSACVEG